MALVKLGDKKVYSFKSVGEQTEERALQKKSFKRNIPFGIKTPVALSSEGTEFIKMNYTMADQVGDNFKNMILTNHGERLGFPDFGANLMELAFELQSEAGQTEAINRISLAVGKYMPYLIPSTFEPITEYFDNKTVAKVGVRITYSVPKLSVKDKVLEVIIYSAS
tara:strand:- start:12150 stop:12647 length:498 start_codon:yes stop_codon:yes gene_type:complete